jgi:ABC-type sugar transport system permease subunit
VAPGRATPSRRAGPRQSCRRITYPMLKPIFLILVLLSVVWDFNVFTQT